MIKNKMNIALHVALWLFMALFIMDYHWHQISWIEALGYSVLELFTYVLLFYTTGYFIREISKSKTPYLKWILPLLFIPLYVFLLRFSGLDYWLYEGTSLRNLYSIIVNASLFTMLSYLFYFYQKYLDEKERNLILDTQNKEAQLYQLKSQLNPHYLFNVFNNLYGLIASKSEDVQPLIRSLTSILRYTVDDGSQKSVELQKEVNILKEYINMILLQQPATEDIDFYVEGKLDRLNIIPFLLITLLENAIKHGDYRTNPNGFLHVELTSDDIFELEIKNSFNNTSNTNAGIGLKNVKSQLEIAYPGAYQLITNQDKGVFRTYLSIHLSQLVANEL